MRRRVFVIAGEYSANQESLRSSHAREDFRVHRDPPGGDPSLPRSFFRGVSRRGDETGWRPDLTTLLASAAQRALGSLATALGGGRDYREACARVTHLHVTSMPGLDPDERVNFGIVPQTLRGLLGLSFRCQCQAIVGTSDSGAWAFADAVRLARTAERPATVLVTAGQVLPSGYLSQYRIRQVMGEGDQRAGLDMLVAGDLWMDVIRRTYGVSREEVERLLAAVSKRKFEAARSYPSAMLSGEAWRRDRPRTNFYDAGDIAPPCCGATAAIVTSDEALAREVSRGWRDGADARHERLPLVEVLGVGGGSSNPSLTERRSPLAFTPSVLQALAATADDAELPGRALAGSAFAVLHDAFPAIELAFLLGLGLGWDEAAQRMASRWSNPLGGLVTFGHAIGASGLVQVARAFHVFTGDRRYVVPREAGGVGEAAWHFPDEGARALLTSVGGPLSHIVAVLLQGGGSVAERLLEGDLPTAHGDDAQGRRLKLRQASLGYLQRLKGRFAGEGRGEACLVEGTTRVHARSCLTALTREELDALVFPEVERRLEPAHRPAARARLRELLEEVWDHARTGALRYLETFDDAVDAEEVRGWHAQGWWLPGAKRDFEALAREVRDALQVELALVSRATESGLTRERRLLPWLGPDGVPWTPGPEVDLVLRRDVGGEVTFEAVEPGEAEALLPWWNARARRAPGRCPPGEPAAVAEALALRPPPLDEETEGTVSLLRAHFTPFASDAERALSSGPRGGENLSSEGGASASWAVCWHAEVQGAGASVDAVRAFELLARAVERSRGWLAAYEVSASQTGGTVTVACLDPRPGERSPGLRADVVRFARAVASACGRFGFGVRAAVCAGEGVRFEEVNGAVAVGTVAVSRAVAMLSAARAMGMGEVPPEASWLAVDRREYSVADGHDPTPSWLGGWRAAHDVVLVLRASDAGGASEEVRWGVYWTLPR